MCLPGCSQMKAWIPNENSLCKQAPPRQTPFLADFIRSKGKFENRHEVIKLARKFITFPDTQLSSLHLIPRPFFFFPTDLTLQALTFLQLRQCLINYINTVISKADKHLMGQKFRSKQTEVSSRVSIRYARVARLSGEKSHSRPGL